MMKTNEPFDRDEILSIVRRTIEEVSNRKGNLGAIVQQAMSKLSIAGDRQHDPIADAHPIPLADVADYVNGLLTDTEKSTAIDRALRTDPGLMMEIVAAVRSQEQPSQDELSAALRSRLVSLHPSHQSASQPDLPTPPPVVAVITTEKADRVIPRPSGSENLRLRRAIALPLALLATAAFILLAIGGWMRWGDTETLKSIAEESLDSPQEHLIDDQLIEPSTRSPLLVDQDDPPSSIDRKHLPRSPIPSEDDRTDQTTYEFVEDTMVPDPIGSMARTPEPSTNVINSDRAPTPQREQDHPPIVIPPESTLVAQWNQIDGLLLRRQADQSTADSSASDSIPQVVAAGNQVEWAERLSGLAWSYQTLPLCRATAQLDSGGELVLAADTQVEFGIGGVLNLHHGSIALMQFGEHTIVRLGRDLTNSVSLASPAGGSMLVRKTLTGVEIDLVGEPVLINDQPYADARIHVDESSLAVQSIDQPPERLPRWTRERTDRIEIGRNVLAQLNESDDVRVSMMQSLRSGAVRGDAATTLRMWLIAASQNNLLRLIGSQDPLIRETALQRLHSINPNDPRHRLLWRSLSARNDAPRTLASIRTYFVDLWSGQRPNALRAEQLLRLYQAPDPATRATANYLLNAFYGAGPRFDLNDPATAQTRAVNGWRLVIQRIADQR